MDWLTIIVYGIPAVIVYLYIMSLIYENIDTSISNNNWENVRLRDLRKKFKNLKFDDDNYCIKEKILIGLNDYYMYKYSYGRKYYDKAEDELWNFLMEYLDKDKLFLDEL